MGMYSDRSFELTKEEHDYLLPVFGICTQGRTRLMERMGKYFFIGEKSEYLDALERCLFLD